MKNTNPNIIKATRQAIFDFERNNARYNHYNGYSISKDVLIFEVNKTGNKTWEVKFWEKAQSDSTYNKDGYSFATIEKQKSGSYTGNIANPGGPFIREDETY